MSTIFPIVVSVILEFLLNLLLLPMLNYIRIAYICTNERFVEFPNQKNQVLHLFYICLKNPVSDDEVDTEIDDTDSEDLSQSGGNITVISSRSKMVPIQSFSIFIA